MANPGTWTRLPLWIRRPLNRYRLALVLWERSRTPEARRARAPRLTWEQCLRWGGVIDRCDPLKSKELEPASKLYEPIANPQAKPSSTQLWEGADR